MPNTSRPKTHTARRFASGGHRSHPANLAARRQGVLERLNQQAQHGPFRNLDSKAIRARAEALRAKWGL